MHDVTALGSYLECADSPGGLFNQDSSLALIPFVSMQSSLQCCLHSVTSSVMVISRWTPGCRAVPQGGHISWLCLTRGRHLKHACHDRCFGSATLGDRYCGHLLPLMASSRCSSPEVNLIDATILFPEVETMLACKWALWLTRCGLFASSPVIAVYLSSIMPSFCYVLILFVPPSMQSFVPLMSSLSLAL